MKKKMNQLIGKGILPMSSVLTLVPTSHSQAAVTVYFEQDGPNVTASWSGDLDPGHFLPGDSNIFGIRADDDALLLGFGAVAVWDLGAATLTSIGRFQSFDDVVDPDIRSFGFSDEFFFVTTSVDPYTNPHPPGNPIKFSPSTDIMTFSNTSLTDLGADAFNDTLAWTSFTNDTVSFTTGPAPIPEPSTALLGILGSLGLLRRRR